MISNVVLITIDSLRADHLSCLGYHRKTSPVLDEIAKKGVLFTHAFSNASQTPTSFPSILMSTYPLMSNYENGQSFSVKKTMISEILGKEGYSTGAFHCNPYLSSFYGYDRGFDTFNDLGIKEHLEKIKEKDFRGKVKSELSRKIKVITNDNNPFIRLLRGGYRFARKLKKNHIKRLAVDMKHYSDAHTINQEAISWLQTLNSKFFLWMHYMDVHIPYLPSQKHLRDLSINISDKEVLALNKKLYFNIYKSSEISFTKSEIEKIISLYDAEIRYVDEAIKLFLDKIDEMGLLDSTLVIITSDHGEEFLEHKGIVHGRKLYDELLHVPLIVYSPKLERNIQVDEVVSLIDVAPTILEISGFKKPKEWLGESLLPLMNSNKRKSDNGIISETFFADGRKFSYRTKHWKFIFTERNEGEELYELYNLKEDPGELYNLGNKETELVREFVSKIREHISMEERITRELESGKMSEDKAEEQLFSNEDERKIKDRLRALGYLE